MSQNQNVLPYTCARFKQLLSITFIYHQNKIEELILERNQTVRKFAIVLTFVVYFVQILMNHIVYYMILK